MKLLLEWSSHLKEIVRNVHNDRVLERLQDPMVQFFVQYIWGVGYFVETQ